MVVRKLRKRVGWFGHVRVTQQYSGKNYSPERWLASFRYIWDADSFIKALCASENCIALDGDYCAPQEVAFDSADERMNTQ